ncbi:MAG: hypothetical protein ACRD72_09955 [Candidatus Angelobacter sp.]
MTDAIFQIVCVRLKDLLRCSYGYVNILKAWLFKTSTAISTRGNRCCPLLQPQQLRRNLQLPQQSSCRLGIDPAINDRPHYHRKRRLNHIEIMEDMAHFELLMPALPHYQGRLLQHRPPFLLPSSLHRLLPRMRITDMSVLLRRRFALLSVPAKHLASPVIRIPRFRHPALQGIVTVALNTHVVFPITR